MPPDEATRRDETKWDKTRRHGTRGEVKRGPEWFRRTVRKGKKRQVEIMQAEMTRAEIEMRREETRRRAGQDETTRGVGK